jgi:DNA-binding MarR family transcriptional regulator
MIGSLRCAGTGRMVKAGISMTHLHILWVLEHHGELPMSRLADLLDVSLSNATGLVDRM